ncbi:ABC transporter substrate-binding protein [Scatolibacter rhodanostii]|uniref:ABC transporter substrate-binding protein n=1 Tax=Scatolibacter rhodanostii TaxID=2014781 RepID=UPI000C07354A|nr:extracellular solute-binding protein [Scatolibacter rhodanostii]
MKLAKRMMAVLLSLSLTLSLAACGDSAPKESSSGTSEKEASANVSEVANDEEPITLKLVGPGLFTTVGETGSMDLVTGLERPGYQVVVERWNELHPNVKLEIETSPWDNWKAVLQTAALSNDVDVLLHGSSITAIAEPIGKWLDEDPSLDGKFSMLAMRRTEENGGDFSKYIPYGLTITANPLLMVLDKEIFNNYGVTLPDGNWSLEDVRKVAESTTGIDPVTGKQTYGISMLGAGSANKNYIWVSRAMDVPAIDFGPTLKETKVNYNTPETAAVFDYINSLYPFSSPDYLEGLDMETSATADSNLAMFITESSYDVYNKLQAGDLLDRFMFLPLPNIEKGENAGNTSSHMGDWNMAVCNTSENKEMAWEFIKFMATDPVVQEWLVESNNIPNYLDGLSYLEEAMEPAYYTAIEQVLKQQPLEFSASTNVYYDSGNFGTLANDLTTVINEIFVGNMTSQQAAEFVQKNADDFMKGLQ